MNTEQEKAKAQRLVNAEAKRRRKLMNASNKQYGPILVELKKEDWPKDLDSIPGSPLVEMWRSNRYAVRVYDENNCKRISVNRTTFNNDGSYKANISWDELQNIKTHIGFGDKDAIEIYPNDKDVVNNSNVRHIWIMPSPLGCVWRQKVIKPEDSEDFAKIEEDGELPDNVVPIGEINLKK